MPFESYGPRPWRLTATLLEDDWSFFDLGGHSLTGLSLTLGIEEMFGIELSGTEIYEYPTIRELAAFLDRRGPNMTSRPTLAEDSILDPEISPRGDTRTTRLSEASSVLITGATGFLGAFLLDHLLQTTGQDTRFYCLVRDRDYATGKALQPGAGNAEILRAIQPVCC